MKLKNFIFEREGKVGILKVNNPKTLNALNTEILKELDSIIDMLKEDDEIYVIIISGEGKAFVAGADITEMKDLNSIEGRCFGKLGTDVLRKIELMDKPVIAAVNGFALGGGCELAMCCDIIIAGENAKFGLPEVTLGISPGFGGTQRLPKIVGIGKAKELIYTGAVIDAHEAERIGLINRVYPQEDLMEEAVKMATKISSVSQTALRNAKNAIDISMDTNIDIGTSFENDAFGLCFSTEDQKEGMSAFLEKRKPKFVNRQCKR